MLVQTLQLLLYCLIYQHNWFIAITILVIRYWVSKTNLLSTTINTLFTISLDYTIINWTSLIILLEYYKYNKWPPIYYMLVKRILYFRETVLLVSILGIYLINNTSNLCKTKISGDTWLESKAESRATIFCIWLWQDSAVVMNSCREGWLSCINPSIIPNHFHYTRLQFIITNTRFREFLELIVLFRFVSIQIITPSSSSCVIKNQH